MKYSKKQAFKKRMVAVFALAMALIMVLSVILPVLTMAAPMPTVATKQVVSNQSIQEEQEREDILEEQEVFGQDLFQVDIKGGYEGAYSIGNPFPISGTIKNLGEGFRGKLKVKGYVSEYTDQNTSSISYIEYYQDIDIPTGATQKLQMDITLGGIREYIEVCLEDENETIVYQNHIRLDVKSPETIMVGVLGEDTQDLNYMELLTLAFIDDPDLEYGEEYLRDLDFTVMLEAETFPKTIKQLEGFQVIIIDGFDLSTLGVEQIALLEQWVLAGGQLVLGTGVSGEKTVGQLPMLNNIEISGRNTHSIDVLGESVVLAELTAFSPQGEPLPEISEFVVIENEDKDFLSENSLSEGQLTGLWVENGQTLLSGMAMGKGNVIFSHGNLSLTPLAQNQVTIEQLQNSLKIISGDKFQVSNNNYDDDDLNRLSSEMTPFSDDRFYLVGIALIVYILLVGPVFYVILKKKDKREKGWILIPICSFAFMAGIFLISQGSSYKDGMLQTASIVTIHENTPIATADIGISVGSAKKGDLMVTAEEELSLNVRVDESYSTYSSSYENQPIQIDQKLYSQYMGKDKTEIIYPDQMSWNIQDFIGHKVVDLGGVIECNVVMKDGKYVGEVTNHTNVDFYNVELLLGDYTKEFSALASGETMAVDVSVNELVESYNLTYDKRYQARIGEITELEAYTFMKQEALRESRHSKQGLQNNRKEYEIPIAFYGYSDTSVVTGDMKVNGKNVPQHHISMYQQDFSIDLTKTEEFQLEVRPDVHTIENMQHYKDLREDIVYGEEAGSIEVSYEIPQELNINEMSLKVNLPVDPEQYHLDRIPNDISILNATSGGWDSIKLDQNLEKERYTDEYGLVRIRLNIQEKMELTIPTLIVKGGTSNVGN